MDKHRLTILAINITKRILLLTAVVSISQCSGIFGYEPHLDMETANLLIKKKNK